MGANIERDFPHEFHEIEPEVQEKLIKDFRAGRSGFVQVGKERWLLPMKYKEAAKRLYNFEVRSSDVWVVTYPRSGTTWTQEMVWLIANDFDFATALRETLPKRFPFFEYHIINHKEVVDEFLNEHANSPQNQALIKEICEEHLEELAATTKRRFIKTHLPFSLLPPDLLTKGCKVIYVARNPKDVAVSYYHLSRLARNIDYCGGFEKFWEYFTQDLMLWSPYWNHIQQAWLEKSNNNLCFLFYEDLCENLCGSITRVAQFLGKSATQAQIDRLKNHLKIDNFKDNRCVNSLKEMELGIFRRSEGDYVRKGVKGGWRGYFSEEMLAKADNWIEMNEKRIGIEFRA